jgi:hypothetical protein
MSDLQLSGAKHLYPREVDLKGNVMHSRYCKRTPRRYDYDCERCLQLIAGAKPRQGWQRDYVRRKLREAQRGFQF